MKALIAGAGTSGLVASLLLRKAGWEVTIIEPHSSVRTGTRAPTLWPPALHILNLIGITDQILSEAHLISALKFQDGAGIRTLDLGEATCVTLSQSRLEQLLEASALAKGVEIRRDAAVISANVEMQNMVQVRISMASGEIWDINVDLLIGADGYHSTVRSIIGAKLQGSSLATRFELMDVSDKTINFDRDSVWTYTGQSGVLVVVPLPGDLVRFVAPCPAEGVAQPIEFLRARASKYGFPLSDFTLEWQANFIAHSQQATSFVSGSIALIGDAAHVQSPAGGRGMNQGIEDAFTLISEVVSSPDNLPGALARYASLREAEMQDELEVNAKVTSHWTDINFSNNPGAIKRTELETVSCAFRRFTAGKLTEANEDFLGRRMNLDSHYWPTPSFLHVVGGEIHNLEATQNTSGVIPKLVGSTGTLQDGVYGLSPTMNILIFTPLDG